LFQSSNQTRIIITITVVELRVPLPTIHNAKQFATMHPT
jgi:hypothetical protein